MTGNPNIAGCETPTGCFAVDAMKSPSVLTGEGYAAEVTYWMPFAGNGVFCYHIRQDFPTANGTYLQAERIILILDLVALLFGMAAVKQKMKKKLLL